MTDTLAQADAARAIEEREGPAPVAVVARKPRSDKGKPRATLVLSPSEISTLATCPQLYFNGYEQGRAPANEDNEPAEWGNYFHRSAAQFYRALRRGLPVSACLALALRQIDRRALDNKGKPYGPPADPFARAMLRAVVTGYFSAWGEHDREAFEVLKVESRYKVPALRGEGRERRGFENDGVIDLVLRARESGRVVISDHKTTRSDFTRQGFWTGAEMNPQARAYVDVAARMGLDPEGFLFDMIKRPGLARAEKPEPGERPADFERRMIEIIEGNRARYFARYPIAYQEWQLARAREDVIARGEEVLWRRRTGHWPQNHDACGKYGSTCAWIRACRGEVRADDDRLFPLKVKREEGNRG